MFTEPKIISSENLQSRSYVTFYFNGIRKREYSGNNIGKSIFPNSADTIEERDRLLRKLKFELQIALENNCYPLKLKDQPIAQKQPNSSSLANYVDLPKPSTKVLLLDALNKKLNSKLSRSYKRNLKYIHLQFVSFLTTDELDGDIANISNTRIEVFLSQFKSSGTYYMNKRRDLGVLFSVVSRATKQSLTSVKETERSRVKATLHKSYDKEQLKPILNYLKEHQHMYIYAAC